MHQVKRVAAIHDLSGIGRSSLAVVLPILSCMGVQVCPVPTAILSTQTSGFRDYSFVDLTMSLPAYVGHWQSLGLTFDCIYSGFLGSKAQIELVSDFIDHFADDQTMVVVDPVLGDDGALYDTMDPEMVGEMLGLIQKADLITPNFTEFLYLIGASYRPDFPLEQVKEGLRDLSGQGPRIVIATSVPLGQDNKQTMVLAYDGFLEHFAQVTCDYIPASYPGTGDIFASVVVGCLLRGDNLAVALQMGVDFVTTAIRNSYQADEPTREGVVFEPILPMLFKK